MRDMTALAIRITLGIFLAGCSGGEEPSPAASSELDARTGSSTASIEVVGGPMAGKHTLSSSEAACMVSEGFEINLGLLATDPRFRDPKALTLLSIALQDVSGIGPVPHDKYGVGVHFGPLQDDQLETVYLSGAGRTVMRKGGTGTVILKDQGKNNVDVMLDLQPEAGVVVKGTVRCGNVIRY
jgi:hypothetical protein